MENPGRVLGISAKTSSAAVSGIPEKVLSILAKIMKSFCNGKGFHLGQTS